MIEKSVKKKHYFMKFDSSLPIRPSYIIKKGKE